MKLSAEDRVTVVSAEPGFAVLHPVIDGDRVTALYRNPVVAWAIETFLDHREKLCHCVDPVPIEDLDGPAEIIRRPDGLIVFLDDREFESEEEALAYAEKLHRRQLAARSVD